MGEQGLDQDEIEIRLAKFRATLLEKAEQDKKQLTYETDESGRVVVKATHQIAEAQEEKNIKLRQAFGISQYFIEGSSLNPQRKMLETAARAAAEEKTYAIVRTPSPSAEPDVESETVEKSVLDDSTTTIKSKKNKKEKKSKKKRKKKSAAHSSEGSDSEGETKQKRKDKKKHDKEESEVKQTSPIPEKKEETRRRRHDTPSPPRRKQRDSVSPAQRRHRGSTSPPRRHRGSTTPSRRHEEDHRDRKRRASPEDRRRELPDKRSRR